MSNKKESKPEFVKHFEKDQEETAKISRMFSIDDFIGDADEIRIVDVPELNLKVKYKRLTAGDIFKLGEIKSNDERGLQILFLMLNKADANVTLDKVKKLDPFVATRILAKLTEKTGFLQPQK